MDHLDGPMGPMRMMIEGLRRIGWDYPLMVMIIIQHPIVVQ
jgi:hypothetical protein